MPSQSMNTITATLARELKEAGWHSRGYLPHFDGPGIPQSVTFRVADSLPQAVLARWKRELVDAPSSLDSTLRKRIETYLDQGYGSCALSDPHVAMIVQSSLLHFDGERYSLWAWVIMPNHVHVLLTPCIKWQLSQIMKDMKSFTSREANKHFGRQGRFWMQDYFDRYIRNRKHFSSVVRYIEHNPVKARLCVRAEDWKFSSAWFRLRE